MTRAATRARHRIPRPGQKTASEARNYWKIALQISLFCVSDLTVAEAIAAEHSGGYACDTCDQQPSHCASAKRTASAVLGRR
jgi:hypothetical protein